VGRAENVELVRRFFAGIADGEPPIEIFAADVKMRNLAEFPIKGPYEGYEGIRRWWADLAEVIDDLQIEGEKIAAPDDDHVVTLQRMTGTFKSTGLPVDEQWAGLTRIDDGLVVEITGYPSRRQALEAIDAKV
jgi:ketosteroid isomerase-like protein